MMFCAKSQERWMAGNEIDDVEEARLQRAAELAAELVLAKKEGGSWTGKGQHWFAKVDHSALLHALTLLFAVGGGMLTGYVTFQHQAGDIAAVQQRLTFDEATITRLEASMNSANAETRQSLSRVLDQLGNLQVLVERASSNRTQPDAKGR
jgi:hypothetical protein